MTKDQKSNSVLHTQLLENTEAPYIHAYLTKTKKLSYADKTTGFQVGYKHSKWLNHLTVACIFFEYSNTHYGEFTLSLAKFLK